MRNPDRTAKTASALMIGLALVTTVFIVGSSMKRTFAATIEGSVAADYVLSTEGFIGFSPALTAELAELPEIDAITGVRFSRFLVEGHERDVVAADGDAAGAVVDIGLMEGDLRDLGADSIFLHEDPAGDLGVVVGIAFGIAITTALPDSVIATTAIPVGTLGIVVATAALCGVAAGILPARRAARLDVLRAVASE